MGTVFASQILQKFHNILF